MEPIRKQLRQICLENCIRSLQDGKIDEAKEWLKNFDRITRRIREDDGDVRSH